MAHTAAVTKKRLALAVLLGALLVAAVSALAFAAPSSNSSAAQYGYGPGGNQYGPGGKQYGKHRVAICHKGHTIRVAQPAVKAHLRHGDTLGAC